MNVPFQHPFPQARQGIPETGRMPLPHAVMVLRMLNKPVSFGFGCSLVK
jgi:hypothetical protein